MNLTSNMYQMGCQTRESMDLEHYSDMAHVHGRWRASCSSACINRNYICALQLECVVPVYLYNEMYCIALGFRRNKKLIYLLLVFRPEQN